VLRKCLSWINMTLGGLCLFLLFATGAFFLISPDTHAISDTTIIKRTIPKNAFEQNQEAFNAIGDSCLDLKFSPRSLQLPDLRTQLVYYGKNGRPDAKGDRTVLHFAFTGNPSPSSVGAGERLYLLFDRDKTPPQYVFSSDNVPTPLWIETNLYNTEAVINVRMMDEEGKLIEEPANYANFRLPEKENQARVGSKAWEMGKWRVDGSLLVRQKAVWKGEDLFLKRHGGKEFEDYLGKHCIDFAEEGQEPYSIYLGINDAVIWDGTRWKEVEPGEDSVGYPLLIVKKIDERIMNLELWDVGGKGKVALNLVKGSDPWATQGLQNQFRCLGARTHSQYIFEIEDQRMLLRPKDWLLKTEEGWIKLETPESIDAYVQRKETGVLFVFDGLAQIDGKQVLTGVLFNTGRNLTHQIEIPFQKGGASSTPSKEKTKNDKSEDDDDDDFDDDDDEIEYE